MSMTILEIPVRMTEVEANEKFYPNSYVMVNCERDESMTLYGEVLAYAPLKKKGPLCDYTDELHNSGNYGYVTMTDTDDPRGWGYEDDIAE